MIPRIATRRVQQTTKITVQRRLSIPGNILVRVGQHVSPEDIVGQTTLPSQFAVVNIAKNLGIPQPNMTDILRVGENDHVEKGDIIAQGDGLLPIFRKTVKAPATGLVVAIVGHRVLIETESRWERLPALINGTVIAVDHALGVTLEATGTHIEAACGIGTEGFGVLKAASKDPTADLSAAAITLADRQTILLAGGAIDEQAVRRAEEVGVAGIIGGSIDATMLTMTPAANIPVIATAGFGRRPMARQIFEMLCASLGKIAALAVSSVQPPGTPPVILVPLTQAASPAELDARPTGLPAAASVVRLLKGPHTAAWGHITASSPIPQNAQLNSLFDRVTVTFDHGTEAVPWVNLEHLA